MIPGPAETSIGRPDRFRSDIQGLRALAVALVVVFHTGLALPGGFVGVDVFFVVSGYLIIGNLWREHVKTGHINLTAFFLRRTRRLLPALAVMIGTTAALSALLLEIGGPLRVALSTAIAASSFFANGYLYFNQDYFAAAAERNPLLHTWSLSLEEQFYFAAPLALASLSLFRAPKRRARRLDQRSLWVFALGVVSSVSALVSVGLVDAGISLPGIEAPESFAYYSPFARAWQFCVGGMAALVRRPAVRAATAWPVPTIGLILIAASAVLLGSGDPYPGTRSIPVTLGTLLLLVQGGRKATTLAQRILGSSALGWVGDRSYGIYLWHWPFIVLTHEAIGRGVLVTMVAVGVSVAFADASLRFLERPSGHHWLMGRRAGSVLLISITGPVLIAGGLLALNEQVASEAGVGTTERSWARDDCLFAHDDAGSWPRDLCIRSHSETPGEGLDVLLVGDSHADALADGLLTAAQVRGLSLGVWTVSGQPPHGNSIWSERFLEVVALERPAVVVMAARSTGYFGARLERWAPELVDESIGEEDLANAWGESLRDTVARFTALNVTVVLVHNVPEYASDQLSTRGGPTLLAPRRAKTQTIDEVTRQRGSVVRAEVEALVDLPRAFLIDPVNSLCRPDCRNADDEGLLYFDDNHLSPRGSRMLTPAFIEILAMAIPQAD